MIFIYIIAGFLSIKCITPLIPGSKPSGDLGSFSAIYVGDRNIYISTPNGHQVVVGPKE